MVYGFGVPHPPMLTLHNLLSQQFRPILRDWQLHMAMVEGFPIETPIYGGFPR